MKQSPKKLKKDGVTNPLTKSKVNNNQVIVNLNNYKSLSENIDNNIKIPTEEITELLNSTDVISDNYLLKIEPLDGRI